MIDISNDPHTGLVRKVISKRFIWDEDLKQVIIECNIGMFKDDVLINNAAIKPRLKKLVATEDTLVKPTDGSFLTTEEIESYNQYKKDLLAYEETNEGEAPTNPLTFVPIGEYSFYAYVLGVTPIILPNLLEQIILLRDSQGKLEN